MTDMLKKSEKINTSDAYVKSDNLTEQWNKGKLPEGDYYIKRRNGYLPYDNIDSHGVWRNSIDEDIVEVLAQVPSYELWKAVHEQWKVLFEENTELKKLLKSALSWLPDGSKLRGMRYAQLQSIKRKIAQVLGEK